jgi:hypothetical protein
MPAHPAPSRPDISPVHVILVREIGGAVNPLELHAPPASAIARELAAM